MAGEVQITIKSCPNVSCIVGGRQDELQENLKRLNEAVEATGLKINIQ